MSAGGAQVLTPAYYTYYLSSSPHPGSLSPSRPAQQVINVKADATGGKSSSSGGANGGYLLVATPLVRHRHTPVRNTH